MKKLMTAMFVMGSLVSSVAMADDKATDKTESKSVTKADENGSTTDMDKTEKHSATGMKSTKSSTHTKVTKDADGNVTSKKTETK